jgi:CHAT domain-containing protein
MQIAEEINDIPNQIDLVNKLGALFEQHGEHHRAIGCLNKLLQIHHDEGDKDAELAVLGSLASISYETEDYEMAVKHYTEILEKAIELGDRELQGKVYSNLGTAHQELEDVEAAQKNYKESLDIAIEVADKLMESRAYQNLADLHSMNGEYEDSASYYTKTIDLCKELEQSFENMKTETPEGATEEDITVHQADCEQKVTMCKDTQGKAYADLAAVHHELEKSAEAMEDMNHAIRLAEEVGDKQAEGERLTQLAALKLYGNVSYDNEECQVLLNKSVSVWRQYAVALRQQLLHDLDNEEIENPDLANTRAAQFFEEHASTYASLQKVLVAQSKENDALVVAEEGRTQALYDLLQLTGDAAPVDPENAPMQLDEITQVAKDNDTSLVVYSMVEADRTLYIWVINAAGEIKFHNINLEEVLAKHDTSLSQAVRQLYETMAGAAKSALCRGPRDTREGEEEDVAAPAADAEIPELCHLHEVLFAPIKDELDASKDVVFIPHGVLSLVPFTALRDGAGAAVIDSHAVSTAPSARVLRTMLARSNELQGGGSLVVGNPVTLQQYELQEIPGSGAEAQNVADILGGECTLWTGDDARMQKVASMMQNVSMLHFACHSQPGILVFAPTLPGSEEEPEDEEEEPEYDDGLLHKEHVHCLRLLAKPTVVLSGSYTAAGSITEDGIVGLPRAFIAAGAKSVLATMWATQDESAPALLKAWHNGLKESGSQAKALRAAILAVQQEDGGKFKHPVHWAGFTLLGNPKA